MNAYTGMSYREIAPRYNAINALPESAARQVGQTLHELVGDALILDLGAGAGRLALPATQAGCRVIALDLERAMLDAGRVEAAAREVNAFDAVQASAVVLPFTAGAFAAVMINNLLHLVPEWERVLEEAERVSGSGRLLLLGRDWLDPASCAGQTRSQWRAIVGALRPDLQPTAAAGPALFQALARRGACVEREVVAAEWTEHLSPASILHHMRERSHNETWALDDEVLAQGLSLLEPWVDQKFPDPTRDEAVMRRFVFTLVRWSSARPIREV